MKNNNQNLSKELFYPVISCLKNKEYDVALELLEKLSTQNANEKIIFKFKASIYLKKKDWNKSIFYYEKIIDENNKYQISNNIGVALFNLGKLSQAIIKFKDSIKANNLFLPALENLGMTYKLLGNYESSVEFFLKALKLNPSNNKVKNYLIDICNYHNSKEFKNNIIDINKKINELTLVNFKEKLIHNYEILKLFEDTNEILEKNFTEFDYPETQIFRKNKLNLNCKRHLTIFYKHEIIPSFCFDCYKVQITLNNVIDLIKLYFYFNNLKLENNNIRKCIIELRKNINGNYKGYIFANSITESEKIIDLLKDEIKLTNIDYKNIEIKHGCTEYYNKYTHFEKIGKTIKEDIYREHWHAIEKEFDDKNLIVQSNKEKVFNSTLNGFNLSDFLIIKNWLLYAKIIGDESYKEIYKFNLKDNHLIKILVHQIDFRKKELIQNKI